MRSLPSGMRTPAMTKAGISLVIPGFIPKSEETTHYMIYVFLLQATDENRLLDLTQTEG